jgi:hypothetical protein
MVLLRFRHFQNFKQDDSPPKKNAKKKAVSPDIEQKSAHKKAVAKPKKASAAHQKATKPTAKDVRLKAGVVVTKSSRKNSEKADSKISRKSSDSKKTSKCGKKKRTPLESQT